MLPNLALAATLDGITGGTDLTPAAVNSLAQTAWNVGRIAVPLAGFAVIAKGLTAMSSNRAGAGGGGTIAAGGGLVASPLLTSEFVANVGNPISDLFAASPPEAFTVNPVFVLLVIATVYGRKVYAPRLSPATS